MRKILLLLLAFVSLTLTLKAQTQSLEDMKLQLEQSDTLYEAEKYDEVLEICLSIGRSTERCDSEQERTVYVRSQILACRCYDQLERYQEGYELSKRLMATQLTDEEKKELSDAYVNSAYFLAVPMMKGKNTDYGKARALLEEVLPYANENDWTIVMNKIGASWYFEGSVYYRKQDYDKTKECARRGVEVFRKTGKVSDEIATLNLLADAYYYQYDLSSAMETYRYALSQAKEAGETDLQMNVLSDIWRLCNLIGDVQMAQGCNVAMDSLAEQTTDEVSKMTYYNLQAEKAMRQENYRVAEQWLFRSVSLAEASTSGKLGSLAGIPYFKLSELYLKAGRYDDCIAYAKKHMEPPHEEMSAVGLYRFMGYGQFMAEAYRYKGDKAGCYEAVDTLLGDHYRFIRLSSARELVRMRKADTVAKERTAVLYGGLQYDVASTTMQGEAEKSGQSPFPLDEEDVVCGGGTFAYLPGSEEAIRKVERILGEHHWEVCTYTGAEGTEESFLAMNAHSPRILQLYTHGFYYTPDRASGIDYLKGFTDAMQLSGIVLSGGNAAWTGKELPDGVRGGILTAGTIAGMDLSGTELAVLSACQTGLGKATPEGLYGLQRAFKKAGVGTVVMSLWEISNNVSQEFMTIFYERLMAQNGGWDKQKAFRETKAIIRARHPEPYYWAAFVMLDGCF